MCLQSVKETLNKYQRVAYYNRNTIENMVDVALISFAHFVFASIWFKKLGLQLDVRVGESFLEKKSVSFFKYFNASQLYLSAF